MPLILARLYEEDIVANEDAEKSIVRESLEIVDDYSENMEHRMKSKNLRNSVLPKEEELDRKSASKTLYARSTIEIVNFEDFRIDHIIGRGTFGKVCLLIQS